MRRKPGPLVVGRHVMIPDFDFEKNGMKAYLEVVGFWTEDYLAKKIQKLKQVHAENIDIRLVICTYSSVYARSTILSRLKRALE